MSASRLPANRSAERLRPRPTRMSIDQLAAEVGLTTRTIRSYQTRHLIQPPGRIGRTPFYTDRHLGRIRLVQSLQHSGLSLSAITALLEPDHLLGRLAAPDQAISRTLRANPQLVKPLIACGVLERSPDGMLRVRGTRAVLAAMALRRPGVSAADALRALADAANSARPHAGLMLTQFWLAVRDRLHAGNDDQDWLRDLAIPVLELAMDAAVRESEAGPADRWTEQHSSDRSAG